MAKGLFGPGRVWLTRDENGAIALEAMGNAGTPLTGASIPLLACDVWEHAYHLDYQNERAKYLDAFWTLANWEFAERNYQMGSIGQVAGALSTA